MGIGRTCLYVSYDRLKRRNEADIAKLAAIQRKNPYYGVGRLAVVLGWSERKTRRIRNLARAKSPETALKASTRPLTPKVGSHGPPNLLRRFWAFKDPGRPGQGYSFAALTDPRLKIWVQDFTHICYRKQVYYLAVTMNLATRQVLGWSFGDQHSADLVCQALEEALAVNPPPEIVHSDQGSEYLSRKHVRICHERGIRLSASAPGHPWENGFMESFFKSFKRETKKELQGAKTPAELLLLVANWLDYYSYRRIHSALKMAPAEYARKLLVNADQDFAA